MRFGLGDLGQMGKFKKIITITEALLIKFSFKVSDGMISIANLHLAESVMIHERY